MRKSLFFLIAVITMLSLSACQTPATQAPLPTVAEQPTTAPIEPTEPAPAEKPPLILATTTSTRDSGHS